MMCGLCILFSNLIDFGESLVTVSANQTVGYFVVDVVIVVVVLVVDKKLIVDKMNHTKNGKKVKEKKEIS